MISKDIYSTAQHIRNQIEDINPDKVFFVGNSMGGYAAILCENLDHYSETKDHSYRGLRSWHESQDSARIRRE